MVERLSLGTIVVGICVRQRYMNITFTFTFDIMTMTDVGSVGVPFSRAETNKAFVSESKSKDAPLASSF